MITSLDVDDAPRDERVVRNKKYNGKKDERRTGVHVVTIGQRLLLHMVLHKPCTTNSKRQRSATILALLSFLPIYHGTLQTFVMVLCGP